MRKVTKKVIKNEFCKVLQKSLLKMFDINVSLEVAYGIFKLCTFLPYHIATKNDAKVVLSGVGIFRTYKTNHTGTEVAKYYCSEAVQRILTKGQSLLEYILNPQLFRDPNADPDAVKKTSAKKAEAPKKAVKTSTKKVKEQPVEEDTDVEEVDIEVEEIEETPAPKKAVKASTKKPVKKAPSKKVEVEQELTEDVEDDDFSLEDFEL